MYKSGQRLNYFSIIIITLFISQINSNVNVVRLEQLTGITTTNTLLGGSGKRERNLNNGTVGIITNSSNPTGMSSNKPPVIDKLDDTIGVQENDEKTVHCNVFGVRDQSDIIWTHKKNKTLKSLGISESYGPPQEDNKIMKNLVFPKFNPIMDGIYVCTAKNEYGKDEIEVRMELKDDHSSGGAAIAISITVIGVTLFIVCLFYEFFIKKKNGLTKSEIDAFKYGNIEQIRKNGYAHENANYTPYNQDMELKDKLYVDKKDILGVGAFGMVVRGKLNRKVVAIKMPKPGSDKVYMKSLLSELKVMIYIGKHPNIVTLIGASTKDLRKGVLHVVVDCCSLGSLEKNLKENRDNFFNIFNPNSTRPVLKAGPGISGLNTNDLLLWAYQIARAMEYLNTKKVIHGDLATRNVLVSERGCCKITDFGLSRKLYDYANYVKSNQEPLPWRWMAFESLGEFTFSSKSDVWSYGVVLWELFSLAEIPYPGMNWTIEFVDQLGRGLRLAHPKYASAELYGLMIECWRLDPELRPNFQTLKETFEEIKTRLAIHEPGYIQLAENVDIP